MTKKDDLIKEYKKQFPTLKVGCVGEEIELSPEEYEAKLSEWADNQIQKDLAIKLAEDELALKISQRKELLARLGITEEEAKLLLS